MTVLILASGCAVVLLLPLAWRISGGRFDPFEPIVLFGLAWGVMFVVRPIAIVVQDNSIFFGVDVRATLPQAVLLALVGAVAFIWAYESRGGTAVARRLPPPAPVAKRRALIVASAVAAVGLTTLIVVLPASNARVSLDILLGGRSEALAAALDGTSIYLWYGSWLLAPAALVFIAIAWRERSARIGLGALALSALTLLRLVPLGNRVVLLPFIGGLLVLLYVFRDRRPRMASLAVAVVAALVASFVVLSLRDPETRSLDGSVRQLVESPQVIFRPVVRGPDAEMVQALSAALTVIPERLSYRYGGATIGALAIRPIPRQLWEGKPPTPGKEIVGTVWPQFLPFLDPAFSPLLPLYWDFGIFGVVAGMAIFGLVARSLYEWFLQHRANLSAQLIFSVGIWFAVIGSRNAPVDTIVLAFFLLAPLILLAALSRSAGAEETPTTTCLADR